MKDIATSSLERWIYVSVRPMNLFIRRTFGSPVRAEDLGEFHPQAFVRAVAEGLDAGAAAFPGVISSATNDRIAFCIDSIQERARGVEPAFRSAQAAAPSRNEDVFAVARYITEVGLAVADNPVHGSIEALLSMIQNAEASRHRLRQTREASALYAAELLDLAERWLQSLLSDVMPSLNADFRRAGLP